MQHDPVLRRMLHPHELASAIPGKVHNCSYVNGWDKNRGIHIGLFYALNICWVGQKCRVVDIFRSSIRLIDAEYNRRRSRYKLQVELTFQSLLAYLHVQQPQETTTVPKSQRRGGLGLERQSGVVQLEL